MQKTLHILTICIVSHVALYAQSVPIDSHKRIVARAQGLSTEKFLRLLEQGKIDDALQLIDTSFLRSKTQYADTLTTYHRELSKYLSTSKLSIVVVTPEKKSNTYRCIYHSKKGYNFSIDLYYKKGQSDSRITRISKIPTKEPVKEKKELVTQGKEHKRTASKKAKTSSTSAKRKTVRKTADKS